MPTLTINLPEQAYRAALAFPVRERERIAAVSFAAAEAVFNGEAEQSTPDYYRETDADDLAAIGRSLQAEAEGRIVPGDAVFARLHERFDKTYEAPW